ncbi:hypothetical protein C8R45DRAFT_938797 [Mycena sanguinolenta]|nr:hypothetical protein C8R45DRAFT_938797 [Mycena sanguinolenta]
MAMHSHMWACMVTCCGRDEEATSANFDVGDITNTELADTSSGSAATTTAVGPRQLGAAAACQAAPSLRFFVDVDRRLFAHDNLNPQHSRRAARFLGRKGEEERLFSPHRTASQNRLNKRLAWLALIEVGAGPMRDAAGNDSASVNIFDLRARILSKVEFTNERTDGRTDGRTNERTNDSRTNGRMHSLARLLVAAADHSMFPSLPPFPPPESSVYELVLMLALWRLSPSPKVVVDVL